MISNIHPQYIFAYNSNALKLRFKLHLEQKTLNNS